MFLPPSGIFVKWKRFFKSAISELGNLQNEGANDWVFLKSNAGPMSGKNPEAVNWHH